MSMSMSNSIYYSKLFFTNLVTLFAAVATGCCPMVRRLYCNFGTD